jgi:hypothetical protein
MLHFTGGSGYVCPLRHGYGYATMGGDGVDGTCPAGMPNAPPSLVDNAGVECRQRALPVERPSVVSDNQTPTSLVTKAELQ